MTPQQLLFQDLAPYTNDPQFYYGLPILPNPDLILRKMGKTQEAYNAILTDPHVIGEIRSMRAGALRFEYRLQTNSNKRIDKQSLMLCQKVLDRQPLKGWTWQNLLWTFHESTLWGMRVHEIVWGYEEGFILPQKIIPRPNHRFIFTPDNELRLLTRENPILGEEIPDKKFILTRHMASELNPYGFPLLSTCFWAYTFKHAGMKFLVKFTEKYGNPWATGKYPPGTDQNTQDKMLHQLQEMVENACAVFPSDAEIDLKEVTNRGETHSALINLCNAEMSKALTSQTLATEIQGNGSYAAAQTHAAREQAGYECDREEVAASLNLLWKWITELNIPNGTPPTLEFYEEAEARKDWVEVLDKARNFVNIPVSFAHERLQIPEPDDGEEVLSGNSSTLSPIQPTQPPDILGKIQAPPLEQTQPEASFAQSTDFDDSVNQAATLADQIIARDFLTPIRELMGQVHDLADFEQRLPQLFPHLDEEKLAQMTAMAVLDAKLQGLNDASKKKTTILQPVLN